jgi:23S rRNA pseudouridine1911/1915/1917 synthase
MATRAPPAALVIFVFNEIVEKLFDVIHEDADFLVINKPAGLVCHPTKTDEYSSLISRVRLYLGSDARPQLVNRLDRETSGVTIVAKNEHAARQLRRLWEERQVHKEYLAIVKGRLNDSYRIIVASLGPDEQSRVAIKHCVRSDGAEATTELWVQQVFCRHDDTATPSGPKPVGTDAIAKTPFFSLLKVVPYTGRKHQIRIHLAHVGHPIIGDKIYGGDEGLYLAFVQNQLTADQWARLLVPHHALHAGEVRFQWEGEQRVFRAEPESWFKAFCSSSTAAE